MNDEITLKKSLITEALTNALDKANVPQRQHLMVIQALQRRMADHQKDMQSHQDTLKSFEETLKGHEDVTKRHKEQMSEWDTVSKHLTSIEHLQGQPGEAGYTPIKGVDYRDGKDADPEMILNRILEMLPNFIPEPVPGEDAQIDEDALLKKLIIKIQREKPLDLTHIKGAQKFMKDGVSYKFEELMHGGGSKSSGTGLAYLALVSGNINDVNKTFTFASKPTIVVVNGASYINGFGVTITGTTAVLDNVAGTGGSVYGLG